MRLIRWLAALLLGLTSSFPVLAQDDIDAVNVDPVHHQVVFENDQVRVVHWLVPAGDTTLNHSHPASLNINLSDYSGVVTTPAGKVSEVHDKAGSSSWRPALIHVVKNTGSQPMEGIIVEPKKPFSVRPTASADPVAADPQHQKLEFENEQIRVIRERQPGSFPMHGHPDNLQILLTDMNASITTGDGKTQTVSGKAGDVRWRTATQHTGKNLGDKPFQQIVVEMKGTRGAQAGGE